MIRMIDRVTGTEFWVKENRVDEYLAAGHKLAVEPAHEEKPKPKRAAKKTK